jgi:hypothetical protein
LPPDADEEMLLLVGAALCAFPLALPSGHLAGYRLDPEFRRKWSACLEWIGQRLFAPNLMSGDERERKKVDPAAGLGKARNKARQRDVDANQRTGK